MTNSWRKKAKEWKLAVFADVAYLAGVRDALEAVKSSADKTSCYYRTIGESVLSRGAYSVLVDIKEMILSLEKEG